MSIVKPRSFQIELASRASRIALKGSESKTTAFVTPGGGKTFGASMFANVLVKEGAVNAILYLAPRRSLKKQVEDEFCRPERSFMVGGTTYSLSARLVDTKSGGPGRSKRIGQAVLDGTVVRGFVTTYQDVVANADRWKEFVKKHKVLLIADEVHHVATNPSRESGDDAAFHSACNPLFELAKHRLLLSGTLERHDDRERISWIEYDSSGQPLADISYTRSRALNDEAIHPVVFFKHDAYVEWESDGKTVSGEMSSFRGLNTGRAVQAALKTDYRQDVVERFIADWWDVRRLYPAKAIIVCDTQKSAVEVHQYIEATQRNGLNCRLAISDEKGAHKNIGDFRTRKDVDLLITVSMAHEGLDVPEVTHLLYLSRVRSAPYFAQAMARAQRLRPGAASNWPRESRFARVYVPQDSAMMALIDKIIGEQHQALGEGLEARLLGSKNAPVSRCTPISSVATRVAIQAEQWRPSKTDEDVIRLVDEKHPYARGLHPQDKLHLGTCLGLHKEVA